MRRGIPFHAALVVVLLAGLARAGTPVTDPQAAAAAPRNDGAGPEKADRPEKADASRGNPSHADARAELQRLRLEGRANFEAGITLKSALPLYEAALKLAPTSAVEQFNLGVTQWKLKQPEAGRANVEKARAADPRLPQPPYVLALMEKAAGNTEAAVQLFEQARELAPGEPSIHYQLGSLYKTLGREDASLQAFTHVTALDPYHAGALYQVYQYHRRTGNEERAAAVFKEFSRLKRAASSSRKEVNYEEGPLVLPLLGAPDEQASPLERAAVQLALRASKLALPEPAAALAALDLEPDGHDDLVALSATGRLLVLPGSASGPGAARSLGAEPPATAATGAETLVLEGFVQKAPAGAVAGGPGGLLYAALDTAAPPAWRVLSASATRPLATFDADHDGDLDVLARPGGVLWLNPGNGELGADPEFFDASVRAVLDTAQGALAAPFADSDGVDLLVWDAQGRRTFIQDTYGGRYQVHAARLPAFASLSSCDAADFDNDGLPDLASLVGGRLIIEWNRGGFRFEAGPSVLLPSEHGRSAAGDFDNDGLKDVLLVMDGVPPLLAVNLGRGRFELRTLSAEPAPLLKQAPLTLDLDDDGRLDAAAVDARGEAWIWRNESRGVGRAFGLRLEGVRSVPRGAGTRVETYIGGRYQRIQARGGRVHVGLGPSEYAEVLRITWPNGFVENKFKVDAGRTWSFKESERVSGSCPTLFAWNGRRFEFVTDAFISGPLGVPVGGGRYFPVDHDEWIKVPGSALVPRDGAYELRLTEELREATYIDEVRLYAVDHPADVEVYPNERLGPFPQPPELHLFGAGALRAPVRAVDDRGRDVLAEVRDVDRRYPGNVVHASYAGLAQPHFVAFDLPPDALHSPHLRLYLTGWFYYFESTSLTSLSQRADLSLVWPEVQALSGGEWRRVAVAGVMPGKHKTVVVELGGQVPPDATQLRLFTNVAIYWDAIRYDATPPRDGEHTLTEIALERASLRWHGFSRLVRPAERSVPEQFVYDEAALASLWNPLEGRLTRYGDVLPLVSQADDLLAVFSSGDELAVRFAAADLPEPAPGLRRDYLLHLQGYVKDGDAYTAHAQRIAPLPFRAMTSFPYDERQLRDAPFESQRFKHYMDTYQTRQPMTFTGPRLSRRGAAVRTEEAIR